MRAKDKKPVFICQITEDSLKVAKCLPNHNSKRRFVGLEVEEIPPNTNDKNLAQSLNAAFKKLRYRNGSVIMSLPRAQATCRHLKVPTQSQDEIERIISLQASRFLPYPAAELITGYQAVFTDKEGYSYINLVIVHKDIIGRYQRILQEVNIKNVSVILSSYGLCNFYSHISLEEPKPVMVVDINSEQAELVIIFRKKLYFSRSFKFEQLKTGWENLFMDELNKTQDAYLKELSEKAEAPAKIILTGKETKLQEFSEIIKKQAAFPVEAFSFAKAKEKGINIPENLLGKILNSTHSFTSLIGLGLEKPDETLNLLPEGIKTEVRKVFERNAYVKLILYILGIILLVGLGITSNLNNKAAQLTQLRAELNKIAKEAKPLEDIEKRFQLLKSRTEESPSGLDLLYALHQAIPDEISLNSFSYEEGALVILHGQTQELNSVFAFVTQLQNSEAFRKFDIKVRYATKKKTQAGEIVDVEIICVKK